MKQLIALALILICYTAGFARPVKRIKFPKGATKVVVTGTLNGHKDSQTFLLRVNKGQTLKVSSPQYVTLTVLDPAGEDQVDRDASCNSRAEISPTVAGDYKIVVVECLKADPWKGNFKLSVTVK